MHSGLIGVALVGVIVLAPAGLGAQGAHMGAPVQEVSTIAGSGSPGIVDGPAKHARFLLPTSLTRARDGSLYVSDQAAQRIRVVTPQGTVRTLAGSGSVNVTGLAVDGGYRDGSALQAQFNRPAGLAIGPDGALYIADSFNACIRKLDHGVVSTVVGKPGQPAIVDGASDVARLVDPQALAFDSEGNLYIADLNGGLRMLSAGGVLSTIHLASNGVTDMIGVGYAGGPDPVVVASTKTLLFAYHPATRKDEVYNHGLGAEGNRPFGTPNQVAVIDGRQVVFTDTRAGNVRYLRLPAMPFVTNHYTRIIAGAVNERLNDNAGSRDGTRAAARFYVPFGIAIAGNAAFIADAGNRTIRRVSLPNFRVSETFLDPATSVDDRHYEVALVGASWVFWDSLGDDSICAHLETTLNASHRFAKPVRCHTFRIDSANVGEMADFIEKGLTVQRMDAVIMHLGPWMPGPLGAPGAPQSILTETFKAKTQHLKDTLAPLQTALGIAWTYSSFDVAPSEDIIDHNGDRRFSFPDDRLHQISKMYAMALRPVGIAQYDLYDDLLAYEHGVSPPPLYGLADSHFTTRGNAFVGEHIANGLLKAGLGLRRQ